MFESNPFLERNFSGSNISNTSTYDRHYFPYMPTRTSKPGFLISSQVQFPIVSGDINSPHYRRRYKPAEKVRNPYMDNPFLKSSLLQRDGNNSYMYRSEAVPNYSSNYGGRLYESNVKAVDNNGIYSSYTPPNNYSQYSSYGQQRQEQNNIGKKSSLEKKNSLRGTDGLNKGTNYNKLDSNDNTNNFYNNYQKLSSRDNNTANPETTNYNYNKKESRDDYEYGRRNTGEFGMNTNMKKIDSRDSAIYRISQKPSNQEDDPLKYNLPSFNSKLGNKKESGQSPAWPGQYNKLNEEYDETFKRTQSYITNENVGIQAKNIRRDNVPEQISYGGKNYYLVDTIANDEL